MKKVTEHGCISNSLNPTVGTTKPRLRTTKSTHAAKTALAFGQKAWHFWSSITGVDRLKSPAPKYSLNIGG